MTADVPPLVAAASEAALIVDKVLSEELAALNRVAALMVAGAGLALPFAALEAKQDPAAQDDEEGFDNLPI